MRASLVRLFLAVGLLAVCSAVLADEAADAELAALVSEFHRYSGASVVFRAADLPAGEYYDIMPELAGGDQIKAAKIACREVQKYPPGYLGDLQFKTIGIFQACAAKSDDGFHQFDKALQGYRYYGLYNSRDAVVAAYYTDGQLPLTFHHEIFHHIDRVTVGTPLWSEVFSTPQPHRYFALDLKAVDRAQLRQRGADDVLENTVSDYAAKNGAEDKAETARYFHSAMPGSLLQMAGQPQLVGSQRLLHVLDIYAHSNSNRGPKADWFVAVAKTNDRLSGLAAEDLNAAALVLMLRLRGLVCLPESERLDREQTLAILIEAESLIPRLVEQAQADELIRLFASLQLRLLQERIQFSGRFLVLGEEDAQGINATLRDDVANFAAAAERAGRLASWSSATSPAGLATTQVEAVRLVDQYYRFIAVQWKVTPGTRRVFQHTCDRIAAMLPAEQAALAVRIMQSSLEQRESSLTADGRWSPPPSIPATLLDEPRNKYLANVDAEVKAEAVRTTIRQVQPACVQISDGSGVNVSPFGCVLTAAHVAKMRGTRLTATFPDGDQFPAVCVAIDTKLDLAIFKLDTDRQLPFAQLALEPPKEGTPVVCIGQPGKSTPEGKPTGYEPFNVSVGHIRGFLKDPLGPQALGRTKHDAWTYWGHSGSPIFNEQGEIVALHNSWDPETAMRHAVTQQAIVAFLAKNLSQASAE